LINEGKPTISTHVHSIWPGVTEVIGYAGTIDYVEFTGQYAPHDLFALENFARAVELFDHMTSMIKIDQEPRTYLAEKATGSGIQNLLFADVRTVADARESVGAVRPETPTAGGIAGATSTRDMGYVFPDVSLADWVKMAEEAIVALMIEKREAVEDLEAILDVPGIDMVQFGPGDYSMSIGRPGDHTHPEVLEAQKYTIETCIKKGIRPRIEVDTWDGAKEYLDMGVIDFSVGTDLNIIYDFMKDHGAQLAKALGR
jgi:4-hydroxy-2-oxoheptanedioate aldolase